MKILPWSALLVIGFPLALCAQRPSANSAPGVAPMAGVTITPSAVVSHPHAGRDHAVAVALEVPRSLPHRIRHFAKIGGVVGGLVGVVTGLVVSHYVGCDCRRVPAPVQFAGYFGLEGLVLGAGGGALVGLVWPAPGGVGARQLPNEALLPTAGAADTAGGRLPHQL
jgi:hypothetical protein